MARSILVPHSAAGVIQYQLQGGEEFVVTALTVTAYPGEGVNPPNDEFYICEYVNATGLMIWRQPLGGATSYGSSCYLSAAIDAVDLQTMFNQSFQNNSDTSLDRWWSMNTTKLPSVTVGPGCVARVYALAIDPDPTQPPFPQADASGVFADLHLWVEDVGVSQVDLTPVGPYMLVPGPNA
jgi:hypothetical protein